MADIQELKGLFASKLGSLAGKTKNIANAAADKTKAMSRIAKLTVEINGEKDAMKKAYIEIGKLYYETHKDEPDGFFVQLCDEVTMATESIAAKEAEIAELKESIKDFDIDDEDDDDDDDDDDDEAEVEVIVEVTQEAPAAEEAPVEEAPAEEKPEQA